MSLTSTDVLFTEPHKVALRERQLNELKDGEFLVETLYSAISAGTELTFFNGTNPKTSEGWDLNLRLFRGDIEPDAGEIYPMLKGYMQSGVVVESKNERAPVGLKIGAMYGHASRAILSDKDFWVALPEELDPVLGAWVAHMGPICMNGLLYAADEVQRTPVETLVGTLKGQRVIIFGAGMVGLICGMIATWAGAEEVAIVDGIAERLETATKLGLHTFKAHPGLPIEVKEHWTRDDAMDTGADIALQCTGSDFLLAQALSCLREQGTVIDLGFYQQGANEVLLGKDFHHNRLRHICAQIGAIPRHQQANWNKQRLAAETIDFLLGHSDDFKQNLITHTMPFSAAQEAFDRLSNRDPDVLQVVLQPEKTNE
jgi:threonine dehydrogenase-like Zn-dependent dehydrogenase